MRLSETLSPSTNNIKRHQEENMQTDKQACNDMVQRYKSILAN